MTLEQQLQKLAELGLRLNDDVSIDDLLYSFDRKSYENKAFDLILFVLGSEVEREPWGRSVCSHVWNFDTECITSTGDYVRIVKRLCELSGNPEYLTDLSDHVDLASEEAWLKYTINTTTRHWKMEVDNDWADRMTLEEVLYDIERDGKRFYFKDNGQAMVLFYLSADTAKELNALSDNALQLVNPN